MKVSLYFTKVFLSQLHLDYMSTVADERRDNGFKVMILAGENANEAPQKLGISIKKTKTKNRGETTRD